MLRDCGRILKESVRKSDFLCRFSGDELVIVTSMPDYAQNKALFSRIQAKLDEWKGSSASFNCSLSLSIGCAGWKPGRALVDVLAEADRNMYRQKKGKRRSRELDFGPEHRP